MSDTQYEHVKKSVVSGFVWQGIVKAGVQLLTWASTIIVARLLHPDDYGLMAIQGVYSGLIILLVDFGVTNGLINHKEVNQELLDGFFYLMAFLGLAFFGFYYLITPFIASFYQHEQLVGVMRAAGVLFILGGIRAVPQAFAMRNLAYKYQAVVEGVSALAGTVTVLAMAMLGYGVWSLVMATVVSQGVNTVGYLLYYKRMPRCTFPLEEIAAVFKTGSQIMTTRFVDMITRRADVFFLGLAAGPTVTGYYSMAFSLAGMPLDKVGFMFNQVAFPAFSRLQAQKENAADLFLKLHKFLLLICAPVLLGAIFVVDQAILLILGSKWQPATLAMQVILGINVLRLSERFLANSLMGVGAVASLMRYRLWTAGVLTAAFYIGVQGGLNGLLIAWVVVFPILYSFALQLLFEKLPMTWGSLFFTIRPLFFSALLMCCALGLSRAYITLLDPLWLLIGNTVLGTTVFFSAMAIGFPDDFRALLNLRNTLRNSTK